MVHMQRMAHPGSRMPGPMNPVVSEFNVRILDRLRSLQFAAKVLLFPYHVEKHSDDKLDIVLVIFDCTLSS